MSDQLSKLLKSWEVKVTPDPEFARQVWHRIESRRQRNWFAVFYASLSQPVWAAAVVIAMLAIGWGTGNWSQSRASRLAHAEDAQAYVEAVNPVIHAATHRT
jgi:hypothetical protein